MAKISPLDVTVDRFSEDFRTGEPHLLGCTVRYGAEAAEVLFLEVRGISGPLQISDVQAKLRKLGAALQATAESPQVISVSLPGQE
jgi:hypothetical protein